MEIMPNSYGVSVDEMDSGWLDPCFSILVYGQNKACMANLYGIHSKNGLEQFIGFSKHMLGDLNDAESCIAGGNYWENGISDLLEKQVEAILEALQSEGIQKIKVFSGKQNYTCRLRYDCKDNKVLFEERPQER